MEIRRHIPGFVDVDVPEPIKVNSLKELLETDWMKSARENRFDGVSFWRYSQSPPLELERGGEWTVLAEYKSDSKHKWWVIGYISGDIGLPKFEATRGAWEK